MTVKPAGPRAGPGRIAAPRKKQGQDDMKTSISGMALAGLLALAAQPVAAAGPFDGVWQGESKTTHGRCEQHYRVTLSIRDGVVSGEMVATGERMTVASTVDAGGRFGPVFAYSGRTLVKTAGGRLGAAEGRIRWTSQEPDYFEVEDVGDCAGEITLRRVSDLPQQSALPPQIAAS